MDILTAEHDGAAAFELKIYGEQWYQKNKQKIMIPDNNRNHWYDWSAFEFSDFSSNRFMCPGLYAKKLNEICVFLEN